MIHLNAGTMASYLNLAQRYLPLAVTQTASFSTMEKIACTLPPLPLTIFESHLADPRPEMDFLLSATPEQLLQLPASQAGQEWRAVKTLCQSWPALAQSHPLKQNVYWIWLEFDTSVNQVKEAPNIYFLEGFARYDRETVQWDEMTAVLQNLLSSQPSSNMVEQFKTIFQALPPKARLFSLGNMSGRALTAVRVSLANIPPARLAQYLAAIGWPGDITQIKTIITRYEPLFDFLALDLDVGDAIGPKIGLEFYLQSRHDPAAWAPLFESLISEGLCLPEKREQLMAWTGFSNAYTDADIWPKQLQIPEEEGHYLFIRRFNHVKLSFHTGEPVKAKAYIALQRVHTKTLPLKITN